MPTLLLSGYRFGDDPIRHVAPILTPAPTSTELWLDGERPWIPPCGGLLEAVTVEPFDDLDPESCPRCVDAYTRWLDGEPIPRHIPIER